MGSMSTFRSWALALPGTTEQPHHEISSFRVRGKIFATVPDADHVRFMVEEPEILAALAAHPGACEAVSWGARLSCVAVALDGVPDHVVRELLDEAWLRKAPPARARQCLESRPHGQSNR